MSNMSNPPKSLDDSSAWPGREIPMGRPQYGSIVDALEKDMSEGLVPPGTRLPARRILAQRLNVSLGTITKAYEEAENRGLVTGEVGRGTFVNGLIGRNEQAKGASDRVDLSLNVSPYCGETEVLSQAMVKVARARDFSERLGYHPHEGMVSDLIAVETWLKALDIDVDAGAVCLCNGAQHAISIAVRAAADLIPGGVLTEAACFAGMKNIARYENLDLVGIAMDDEGICPDMLENELVRTGSRLIFLTPTLQTPTATIMSEARRREVIAIAARHDAFIIEDDTYGFLFQNQPTKLHTLAPERVFYISSFSKIIAPALRLGAMVVPRQFQERARLGLASTGWMASPLLAGAFSQMLEDGSLHDILDKKRLESQARLAIARRLIPSAQPGDGVAASFHIWIPLSSFEAALNVYSVAATRGILLTAPDAFRVSADAPIGLRACLGAATDQKSLTGALETLKGLIVNEAFQSII